MAVSDEETLEIQEKVGRTEGLLLCPEGAAVIAAYRGMYQDWLSLNERFCSPFQHGDGSEIPNAGGCFYH